MNKAKFDKAMEGLRLYAGRAIEVRCVGESGGGTPPLAAGKLFYKGRALWSVGSLSFHAREVVTVANGLVELIPGSSYAHSDAELYVHCEALVCTAVKVYSPETEAVREGILRHVGEDLGSNGAFVVDEVGATSDQWLRFTAKDVIRVIDHVIITN